MQLGVISRGGVLVPMDSIQAEEFESLPLNTPLIIEYKEKRNAKNLGRYMTFIRAVFEMQEHYPAEHLLRKALQIMAGHCDEIISHTGRVHYLPRSISYKELDDEILFRKVFKRVRDAAYKMLTQLGINLTDEEFNRLCRYD